MKTIILIILTSILSFYMLVLGINTLMTPKNKTKQGKIMVKMTKVEVEIDLFNLPEIQEFLVEHQEFVEAVRDLRTMEKHYNQDRNEHNLGGMRSAERKVDGLLKKYPKEGWKK